MSIHIEPTAPNTIKFLEYVVRQLIDRQPLVNGKVVRIPAQEGAPTFPEFTENVLDGDPNIKAIDKIEAMKEDGGSKMVMISKYLRGKLKYHTAVQLPLLEKTDPLTFEIPLIVVDPAGLLEFARGLGIEICKEYIGDEGLTRHESTLKEEPPRICFRGKEIRLREGTIQHRACQIMFSKPPNTMIELMDLVDGTFTPGFDNPPDKWRNVYNALNLVNRKVKITTGQTIFKLGKVQFRRIK